ncbi:MAG: amidohydrolase family protein, partial [Proteobacteria bacterium]|nr:amidohydrolase family protein [Pseudomonadota bacterium]
MSARLAACGSLLLAVGLISCARADEGATVIRAGHMVDTELGRVVGPQMILVRGGRIAEVGQQISVPADARVVDLHDYTVLPGLIDAHTHLTID